MNGRQQRLHNRFKLPFCLVCVVCGTMMVIGGAVTGLVGLIVPGVIAAVGSLVPIWVIATGRGNPRWMRSPLDPLPDGTGQARLRESESAGTDDQRKHRAKYGFVLAGAIGFVIAGIAAIAVGAAAHRWDEVFVGVLSCLFFGACAWIGLAVLRGRV